MRLLNHTNSSRVMQDLCFSEKKKKKEINWRFPDPSPYLDIVPPLYSAYLTCVYYLLYYVHPLMCP